MGSLTVCLKKVGDKLDPADKAAVLNRSRELRSGGMGATEAAKEAVKDVISGIRAELKASEPKKPVTQPLRVKHPKTVMGSELLAIISDRLGGLDPSLISEYSVYVPTGKLDKKTKAPLMAWRNPMIPGIGLLFRRGGRQDRQEIAQVLEDADYLEPGAVANDYKEAGERAKDLIKAALDRNIPKTLAEQQAEMEAGLEADRQAYYDALDEESAREADAERAAIMAEAELSRVEVQAVGDADLFNLAGGQTGAEAMRAMGFSEQEIADELARKAQPQGQAAQASTAQDAEAAPGPAPEAGPAGVDAAQRGPEQAAEGLTLEAPTPDSLKARAARTKAAADADAKEQKRLADKAKADAERGDFQLTGSDRAADVGAAAGQGDIFDTSSEPVEKQGGNELDPPAKISDIGEKIGGARKDVAVGSGTRSKRGEAEDTRPAWARRFQISQIVRPGGQINAMRDEGRWIIRDTRSLDWMKQPKQVGRSTFATQEEAEAFVPIAAVSLKHRAVPTRGDKYEIWRDITDRKRVKVVEREFDTRDEAMAYMAANAAAIIETNTTFGEADMPLPPDRARTGPERRTGNVFGEDFKTTFGFRGVEFGNWNNQDERQGLMNDAWDGLMDLSDVLGIPPKAIGLNGDLALAFGARGHGLNSARAHYELDRAVINLTKERGAGSLAHEWFHALDHYFGRQDGKASAAWKVEPDGTRTLKVAGDGADMASSGFRGERSGVRPEVREAYNALLTTMFKKAESYVEDTAKVDKFTGTAREDLARELDKLRQDWSEQKDKRYWKRNNAPASAEVLAEFDTIAAKMLAGELLETDWRTFASGTEKRARLSTRWTNDAMERLSELNKQVRGRSGFDAEGKGVLDRLRGSMNRYSQRLKMLADAQSGTEKTKMVPTDFAMNAKELDQGRGGDYWTTPHEMAARAFQGYVEDKVAERGGVSRFLNYGPENVGIPTPWGFKRPFPAGAERKAINKALDTFVGTLQTRTDDAGNVALLSQGRGRGVPLSTLKPHIDAITAKMPGLRAAVEVVATVTDLPKGIVDSLRSMNALGTVRGLRMPDGRVFLVADKLDSQLEAEFVLFHEVYGHEGLRAILTGDEYARAMTLVRLSNKAVAAEADRWTAAYGADQIDARIQAGMSPEAARREVRLLAIEEALADRAGKNDPPAVWKNVMAAIQKALRRMGMDDLANWLENRTEAETYALLMQARKAITEGKPHALKQVPEGIVASSSAKPADSGIITVQKIPYDDLWVVSRKAPNGSQHVGYYRSEAEANEAAERQRTEVRKGYGGRQNNRWWTPTPAAPIQSTGDGRLDSVGRAAAVRETLSARADSIKSAQQAEGLEQIEDRAGWCFPAAAQAAAAGLGDMVIGRATGISGNVWHAVVQRDGATYDPTFGRWFEPSVYEALGFSPVLTLAPDAVRDYIAKTGGMAPDARNQGLGEAPPALSRRDTPAATAPAVTVQPDENGNPEFAGNSVVIAYPQPAERFEFIPEPGQRLLNYAIMPAEGFDSLGFVELVVENGKVTALMDIEISGAGRRAGVGRKVIETILAANPDADVNISNIVHQARGFWAKMGVPEQNLEDGAAYDGTLNWQAYAQAANDGRAAQMGQGLRGKAGADDRGRQGADRRAEGGAQAPVLSQQPPTQGPIATAAQQPKTESGWVMPEVGKRFKFDNFLYKFQNKNIDLKRGIDAIKKTYGDIADAVDAYLQEELFHGRAAKRTQDFVKDELEPLLADMKAKGISTEKLDLYLHARHAEEANKLAAERNPNEEQLTAMRAEAQQLVDSLTAQLQKSRNNESATKSLEASLKQARDKVKELADTQPYSGPESDRLALSGMATEVANDYLAGKEVEINGKKVKGPSGKQLQDIQAVAQRVNAIIARTRLMHVAYGISSAQEVKGWADMFKHYVPLFREQDGAPGGLGTGQGFSIKGPETKSRTGSTAKVVDILANIALAREKTIVRGEKNRVAQSLAALVKANPNPDIWGFGPVTERRYNKASETVEVQIKGNWRNANNVLVAKVRDDKGNVQEVGVVFNENNERAARMAMALKNLDAAQLEGFVALSAKLTRWFAAINTQYNPIFGFVNLVRDVGGAAINLTGTPLAGKRLEVMKNIRAALVTVGKVEGGFKAGNKEMAALWEEMQREGGMTGFRELYRTSQDRAKDIEYVLNPTAWMDTTVGKIITAGGSLSAIEAGLQKGATKVFRGLSHYNTAMEAAVRLSVYKVALEQGLTKQRAASLAKNITVNFNRKGQIGAQAGAFYAFFNAAMQGTARMGEVLFDTKEGQGLTLKPAGVKIIAGSIAFGGLQALALALAGFDEDEPPKFVRERNIIIPTGWLTGNRDYITIPMPLGWHVLPNIGRMATEYAMSGFEKGQERAVDLIGMVADAFNPMGNAGISWQTLMPTAIGPIPADVMTALVENRDWQGRPIARRVFDEASAGWKSAKDTASAHATYIARALNHVLGGTDHQGNKVWNATPDQIDYLIGQVFGGVARELGKIDTTITASITGEDLPPHKIPLLGRFYGNADANSVQGNRFYQAMDRFKYHRAEMKGLADAWRTEKGNDADPNESPELKAYRAKHPETAMLLAANVAQRQVQALRKEKSRLIKADAPRAEVKEIEAKITEAMKTFNENLKARLQPQEDEALAE